MKNIFLMVLAIVSVFSACKNPTIPGPSEDPSLKTTKNLVIPNGFSFITSKDISVSILVKNSSATLSGVPVSIYLDYPGTTRTPNLKARKIGTYLSQSNGRINLTVKTPAPQDSLYLKTNYLGLESEAGFKITGLTASYNYGEGNSLKSAPAPIANSLKAATVYTYMGQFDAKGSPSNYLVRPTDRISQGLLDSINVSLPEAKSLPTFHPEYFTGAKSDIVIQDQCDLWLTFVSEGTDLVDAVGFYVYDVANPPKTISDIKTYTIIFPNTSLQGSGGNLTSGDKVLVGSFSPGQAIGWFMAANGWGGGVQAGVKGEPTFFSDPALNPETSATKKQHTILFNNVLTGQLILGWEDINRETGGSDEDFNDVLFNITATSRKSVITSTSVPNVGPTVAPPSDTDNDGVIDNFDEFPVDPQRAFTSFYPSLGQYTSLLVEDLWPSLGDFDFNDLVIDDQYQYVTNAQSNVVEMFIKLKVRAIGAGFHNGFGIEFPFAPSVVSSVDITDQNGSVNTISLETGQSKAIVIAFNDAFTLLPSMGGGTGVNVIPGVLKSTPKDIQIHILFKTPQAQTALGNAPNNPFVFIDGDRTKEIHLPNLAPTAKANLSFFGQSDDASNVSSSNYYKSKTNLVWMIEVPSSFSYDIETMEITKAYLNFGAWAQSGGILFQDWYMDKPGYRDNTLIYK